MHINRHSAYRLLSSAQDTHARTCLGKQVGHTTSEAVCETGQYWCQHARMPLAKQFAKELTHTLMHMPVLWLRMTCRPTCLVLCHIDSARSCIVCIFDVLLHYETKLAVCIAGPLACLSSTATCKQTNAQIGEPYIYWHAELGEPVRLPCSCPSPSPYVCGNEQIAGPMGQAVLRSSDNGLLLYCFTGLIDHV